MQALPLRCFMFDAEAEIEDINGSVTSLRLAILELKNNKDQSRTGVLKVNVTDARSALQQRVQQLNPDASTFRVFPLPYHWHGQCFLLGHVEESERVD